MSTKFRTKVVEGQEMFVRIASAKGQIVIPASVRRKFGIAKGTRFQVKVDEKANKIVLMPVTRARMQKFFGIYKDTDLLGALAEDKADQRAK